MSGKKRKNPAGLIIAIVAVLTGRKTKNSDRIQKSFGERG